MPAGIRQDVEEGDGGVVAALEMALGVDNMHVGPTGGDAFESEREQWNDGNNLLCLEPGVVVAYDRNVDTNARLRKAGIEVLTISGPRMTCRRWLVSGLWSPGLGSS